MGPLGGWDKDCTPDAVVLYLWYVFLVTEAWQADIKSCCQPSREGSPELWGTGGLQKNYTR